MTANERRSIGRVLIDLIKADKVIDSREMKLYKELKDRYSITREDEVEAYAITLGEAVNTLRKMDSGHRAELLRVFGDMTMSDGFCAREEAILMLMLTLCLGEGMPPADVIATVIEEPWFDERQVLYVESYHAKDVNFAITTDYRSVNAELKLCGLEFVYLPRILHHYVTTNRELLHEVMGMLTPSLGKDAINGLLNKIRLYKTDTFCIEQLHHKLGFEELADTPPALMMRISQSKVGDKVYTNFLRVGVTADVVGAVRKIADIFLGYHGSDRIVISHKRDEAGSFLYSGFYRQIFEILLLQKSVECHMEIDLIHGTLSFPEIQLTLKGLHRKEKALYVLFVYMAWHEAKRDENGAVIQNGGINFRPPQEKGELADYNRRMDLLQRRYARIYAEFGGEEEMAPDLTNPEIRRPMLSSIKREIMENKDKVYDVERFMVTNPGRRGVYGITAIPESFVSRDFSSPGMTSIFDTALFAALDRLR